MIRLVESPPGHLTGSLVISSLDEKGLSRKGDAVRDLSGTINGPNVSLQLQGEALAGFFGIPTNLVGELHGDTLTLSLGNSTQVFRKISNEQYLKALAGLSEVAQHATLVWSAQKLLRQVGSDGQQLDADLTQYIDWGQQRISHVSTLRQWYAQRQAGYTKCLQTIRPLAAAHVPSWHWQTCVLDVENDKYVRDEMAESVNNLRLKNQTLTSNLNQRIGAVREAFANALIANKSACAYAAHPEQCNDDVSKLGSYSPNGPLDKNLLAKYYATIPQVDEAISTDIETSDNEQDRLAAIARQISDTYRAAR